jgi:hypothetical protein
MRSLNEIRKAYDDNYKKMMEVIQRMGGDQEIKTHRKKQSPLYRKLKEFQRYEHHLDELENRLSNSQGGIL